MTVEHRAAPGLNDIEIVLADHGRGPRCACAKSTPPMPRGGPKPRNGESSRRSPKPMRRCPNARSSRCARDAIRHDAQGRYNPVASPTGKASPPDAVNASHPPGQRAVPGVRFRNPLGVRGNRSREPPRTTARQAPATTMRRAIGPWADTPPASPPSDDHGTLWEIRVPIARNNPGDR